MCHACYYCLVCSSSNFFFHFNLFHIKGIGTVIGAHDRFDIMGFGYEITQEPMRFVVTDIQAESQVPYL